MGKYEQVCRFGVVKGQRKWLVVLGRVRYYFIPSACHYLQRVRVKGRRGHNDANCAFPGFLCFCLSVISWIQVSGFGFQLLFWKGARHS